MELEITPVFPTVIAQVRIPDAESMNLGLQSLIFAEESEYSSLGRSNIGGWHSSPDFLTRGDSAVSALNAWLAWALRRIVDSTAGSTGFRGTLRLTGWAVICRTGSYHAPHSHPDSAWSGVYYVDPGSPNSDHPLSGVLEFLDPRSAAAAVATPGDPYGDAFRIWPQAGLLVVFPSWLYHWVHPYAGLTPRIAVSFNAALAPVGEVSFTPDVQTAGRAAPARNAASLCCPDPSKS